MPKYLTTVARYYNNRRLMAGDELVGVSRRDGEILRKLGRATLVPDALVPSNFKVPPPPVVPPKPAVTETPTSADVVTTETPTSADVVTPESEASGSTPSADTLATVRAEYERVVGKRSFHGWDEAELRRRIAAHEAGDSDES